MQTPATELNDDDFATFDQMEEEKFVSTVAGFAYQKAYLGHGEFQAALSALYLALNKRHKTFTAFHAGDALRMFLGSAYRQACVAEILFEETLRFSDVPRKFGLGMLMYHDVVDGIIHSMDISRSYLSQEAVTKELEYDSVRTSALFDKLFPGLRLARNAIAHEDERLLPTRNASFLEQVLSVQHRHHSGTVVSGLKVGKSRDEISIDFSPAKILELTTGLTELMLEA